MTKTGFVIANLFHKKTRTWLTLLSVVMAFVLFGLLQSLNLVFSAGADFVGATRLVTRVEQVRQRLRIAFGPRRLCSP